MKKIGTMTYFGYQEEYVPFERNTFPCEKRRQYFRIVLAFLILIPSLALADSMVYISAVPVAVATKLGPPSAYVPIAGVKVDQPIALATDGTPVWAVIVTDAQLATINKDAAYLGKGLDAVKVKSPAIYNKITVKQVTLDNGAKVTLQGDAIVPIGATVTATDIPLQTFSGWDAKTGDLESVKPVAEKVIVK
jgi:hypothetical protein